ncbi:hypothetical protein LI328DRAFT_142248 [Trichoderma asperelloides]|nr:hypothetical protein LI328DRAFT_142248 [Trichoderma asperelloides]
MRNQLDGPRQPEPVRIITIIRHSAFYSFPLLPNPQNRRARRNRGAPPKLFFSFRGSAGGTGSGREQRRLGEPPSSNVQALPLHEKRPPLLRVFEGREETRLSLAAMVTVMANCPVGDEDADEDLVEGIL